MFYVPHGTSPFDTVFGWFRLGTARAYLCYLNLPRSVLLASFCDGRRVSVMCIVGYNSGCCFFIFLQPTTVDSAFLRSRRPPNHDVVPLGALRILIYPTTVKLWYCPMESVSIFLQRVTTVSVCLLFVKSDESWYYHIFATYGFLLPGFPYSTCLLNTFYFLLLLQRARLVLYSLLLLQCARPFFFTLLFSAYVLWQRMT